MTPDEESRIRADEREKAARIVEGYTTAVNAKCMEPFSHEPALSQAVAERDFLIASALRSGTDTDYVCVRREELEKVNEFIAREQSADFEDQDDKCVQSEGAREICERALGTHHNKRLLGDW